MVWTEMVLSLYSDEICFISRAVYGAFQWILTVRKNRKVCELVIKAVRSLLRHRQLRLYEASGS